MQNAEFARLGGLHRNTFLNSPKLLDRELRLRAEPRLRFAGQITGCEGYVESAAIGLLAGRAAAASVSGNAGLPPPPTTAFGALLGHITGGHLSRRMPKAAPRSFQPMNVNFGLFPPLEAPSHDAQGNRIKGKDRGVARKRALSARALADLDRWLGGTQPCRSRVISATNTSEWPPKFTVNERPFFTFPPGFEINEGLIGRWALRWFRGNSA